MINFKQVQHIANLARLGIDKKEKKKFASELGSILDYAEKLKKIEVEGVEPFSHPVKMENVMRKDQVQKQLPSTVDHLLKLAPRSKGEYLKVKSIL